MQLKWTECISSCIFHVAVDWETERRGYFRISTVRVRSVMPLPVIRCLGPREKIMWERFTSNLILGLCFEVYSFCMIEFVFRFVLFRLTYFNLICFIFKNGDEKRDQTYSRLGFTFVYFFLLNFTWYKGLISILIVVFSK